MDGTLTKPAEQLIRAEVQAELLRRFWQLLGIVGVVNLVGILGLYVAVVNTAGSVAQELAKEQVTSAIEATSLSDRLKEIVAAVDNANREVGEVRERLDSAQRDSAEVAALAKATTGKRQHLIDVIQELNDSPTAQGILERMSGRVFEQQVLQRTEISPMGNNAMEIASVTIEPKFDGKYLILFTAGGILPRKKVVEEDWNGSLTLEITVGSEVKDRLYLRDNDALYVSRAAAMSWIGEIKEAEATKIGVRAIVGANTTYVVGNASTARLIVLQLE